MHRNCFLNRSYASQFAFFTDLANMIVKMNVTKDKGSLLLNKKVRVLKPSVYCLFSVYEAETNKALVSKECDAAFFRS